MKIIEIDIDKLKPYKLNSKKHPQSQIDGLAESIRRFGFTQPLVVDKNDEIIIGHGRLEGAKLAGLKKIPVVRMDGLNENEVKALRLIDNRIAETGWDSDLLTIDLNTIDYNFVPFNIDFASIAIPEFKPGNENDQSQLDKKDPLICPECGHEWTK